MTLIRVIDFETTGFPPDAGIVEVGWTDVILKGDHADPEAAISIEVTSWQAEVCNPGKKIEIAAMAVHHITEEDIANARKPDVVLNELVDGVDYWCAHNAKFEQEFFRTEAPWLCTLKLAYRLCPKAPNHQNQTIRYFLKTPVNKDDAQPSHRAGPDSYVTAHTIAKFLSAKIPFETMVTWSKLPPVFPYCPIGKNRGKPWEEVDDGFLFWCMKQPSMESDIKWNVQRELNRRREKNREQASNS